MCVCVSVTFTSRKSLRAVQICRNVPSGFLHHSKKIISLSRERSTPTGEDSVRRERRGKEHKKRKGRSDGSKSGRHLCFVSSEQTGHSVKGRQDSREIQLKLLQIWKEKRKEVRR